MINHFNNNETNKKADYNPPIIILKMPVSGQSISWNYKEISGDNVSALLLDNYKLQ